MMDNSIDLMMCGNGDKEIVLIWTITWYVDMEKWTEHETQVQLHASHVIRKYGRNWPKLGVWPTSQDGKNK
jgi:hypothetical protein